MESEVGKIGVIGGSGIYNIDGIELIDEIEIDTPYGRPSSSVIHAKLNSYDFFFIPRHGKNHNLLPSNVNYRANIYALKSLGVEYAISVSAVGSLKEELPPETFVLVDQFIDWTKGKRERTFFNEGIIGHVSCADPIDLTLKGLLEKACKEAEISYHSGGSYICIEGPQFSTRAESALYRQFGASVIGMTNVPESFLAKEAGMAYATVAMVTDYDCWKEEHCTVDEIMKVMKNNTINAQVLLKKLLPILSENKFRVDKQNKLGVLTPESQWTAEQKKTLDILLR